MSHRRIFHYGNWGRGKDGHLTFFKVRLYLAVRHKQLPAKYNITSPGKQARVISISQKTTTPYFTYSDG